MPRQVADVNGDGRADIVGFGEYGVYVALGQQDGTFGAMNFALSSFTPSTGGWSSFDKYPRQMGDVNGDGRADIVAFGEYGVCVALGQQDGTFGAVNFALANFAPSSGGWSSFDRYPRQVADVNGDGRADIVGFAEYGVYVALSKGDGTFNAPFKASNGFTPGEGRWLSFNQFPRQLGDVNGDGRADIVAFGEKGVFVALGQLDGTFVAPHQYNTLDAFTIGAGRWTSFDAFPRQVADVNGDGLADVVGFGESGVYVALNKTPQLPRNVDLVFGLDFKTSGQGIFGNQTAIYSYNGGLHVPSWNYTKEYDFGIGSFKGGTSGQFGIDYGYKIDLGTLNASMPVQTWFDLPDNIQAGQTITLKSGYDLLETANFSTTAPQVTAFFDFICKLYLGASMKLGKGDFSFDLDPGAINIDQSFSLRADSTQSWSTNMDDTYTAETSRFSSSFTQPGLGSLTLAGPNSGTKSTMINANLLSGSSHDTLLKANLDLDCLLGKILEKVPGPYAKAAAKVLEYIEGSAETGVDGVFNAEVAWNVFDVELANDLGLTTDIELFANNLVGTLVLENGTHQNFRVGQDLTFNVGADVNGDGFIRVDATVNLDASLRNHTSLTYQGAIEMTALEASADVEVLGDSFGGGFTVWKDRYNLPGFNASTDLYKNTFTLGGFNSQSFSFTMAVGNRA